MRLRNGRARLEGASVVLVAAVGTLAMASVNPAGATAPRIDHKERIFVKSAPIKQQTAFNADGTPVTGGGVCDQFPGVYRGGKVWADTYAGGAFPIYTQFRMNFWTEYSAAVAAAKYAYQRANVLVWCPGALNQSYKNKGTKYGVAVSCGLPGKPARWCDVYNAHPGGVALDIPLIEKCAELPGGPYAARVNEWHNLSAKGTIDEARLYNVYAILGISVPVFIDDITSLSGVRNFNANTGQPSWGTSWQGYGHVQTPQASEGYMQWFDAAAQLLGKNPYTKPVEAHKAVQSKVDAGNSPSVNGVKHKDLIAFLCAASPKIQDYLDADRTASASGLGQTLSDWVARETNLTLCQNIRRQPEFADAAPFACQNALIGDRKSVV